MRVAVVVVVQLHERRVLGVYPRDDLLDRPRHGGDVQRPYHENRHRRPRHEKIVEKNEGEVVKTENWGLLNLAYLIKKNKKGSYIHFKIKAKGNVIEELEKNEIIDKKLLRYLTVRVKKFDLETNYFTKVDNGDKTYKKDKPNN